MFKSAVIGCGAVSKNHGKALKGNEYTTLEYCVDIDYEKAVAFSETYGGVPLRDYRDLYYKDIDVVHVITPHNTATISLAVMIASRSLFISVLSIFC